MKYANIPFDTTNNQQEETPFLLVFNHPVSASAGLKRALCGSGQGTLLALA